MGLLDDSDSEIADDDVSTCSEDSVEETPKPKPTAKARGVKTIKKCGSSVKEGTVDDRLAAVMALKAEMGMDEDPEYLEKERKKEEAARKAEEERQRLEDLTPEDRIKAQKNSVGDMMSLIKQKRELSKRNLMAGLDGENPAPVKKKEVNKEEKEMEEFRRLKLKKANSKKKLMEKQNSKKRMNANPKRERAVAAAS